MERVLGLGGVFLRADHPVALLAWYRDVLGLDLAEHGIWGQQDGPTVVAAFDRTSDYLGPPTQSLMLGFRVADLDAMLRQVRAHGGAVADEVVDMDGVGRFGWVTDPEGSRIELWQPAGG